VAPIENAESVGGAVVSNRANVAFARTRPDAVPIAVAVEKEKAGAAVSIAWV